LEFLDEPQGAEFDCPELSQAKKMEKDRDGSCDETEKDERIKKGHLRQS